MTARSIGSELKKLTFIGLPILVTQLAHNGMSVTDTIMAGQVSAEDLAGVAVGASIWIPVFLFMTGVIIATTALVSHAYGAGDYLRIARITHQSAWMAFGLALPAFLLCRFSHLYLDWLDISPNVRAIADHYLDGISWGVPAIALYQVLRCYCEAQTDTRSVTALTLIGLGVNIPANYLFIYGAGPIPAMGGAGCGYASALVMWVELVLMLFHVTQSRRYRIQPLTAHFAAPNSAELGRILRLGLPIGFAVFFEASLFCATSLAIASFGTLPLAAHQIGISFTSFTFMVPLSLAMATTVRAGNLLGAGQNLRARHASLSAMILALTLASMTASLMIFTPEWIVRWYSPNLEVQRLAIGILFVAAMFQFSDAIQVTASGALRAYHDTRAVMLITFLSYWAIGFPAALWLGHQNQFAALHGVLGFWVGLVVGLTVAAVLLLVRFLRLSARKLITS